MVAKTPPTAVSPKHRCQSKATTVTTVSTAATTAMIPSATSNALAQDHPCNTSRDSCNSVDDPRDCSTTSSVLDTMDTCINCVEGVEVQRAFDDQWTLLYPMIDLDDDDDHDNKNNGIDRAGLEFGSAGGPIEAATLIRLELMEDHAKVRSDAQPGSATPANLGVPDFDVLNLCGAPDDNDGIGFPNPLSTAEAAAAAANTNADRSTPMPSCGSYTACPRLEKAADTTVDTAQTADVDNSFLSLSTVHDAVGKDDAGDDHEMGDHVLSQCAVCLHEAFTGPCGGSAALGCLPCCGHHLCWPCVEALTVPSPRDQSDGCRVGRCPCCRSWIVVETATGDKDRASDDSKQRVLPWRHLPNIHLVSVAGKCQECCQIKQLLVDGSMCDACIVSRQCPPLAYECDCCQHAQRISHPLYRYQASPDAFGTVGWLCNACNRVSRWRLRPDQLSLVLVGDAPAEWSDDAMEKARLRVQAARAAGTLSKELAKSRALSLASSFELPVGSHSSSCIIV